MKIALIQSKPILGDKNSNIEIIKKYTSNIDAELFVFPELFLTGYICRDYLLSLSESINGDSLKKISKIAKKNDCTIILGFPERCEKNDGMVYNSAALFHPNGDRQVYRKWQLANFGPFQEMQFFGTGNELNVFDTKFGKVGLLICFDIFFPEICRAYFLKGVDILICISASPSATRIYFEKVMVARAIENTAFFLYTNLVGTEESLTFWGGNTVVNPRGEIIAKGGYYKEEAVIADIDLKEIKISRQFRPVLRDHRTEEYKKLHDCSG